MSPYRELETEWTAATRWNAAHPLDTEDLEFEAKLRALCIAALWRAHGEEDDDEG